MGYAYAMPIRSIKTHVWMYVSAGAAAVAAAVALLTLPRAGANTAERSVTSEDSPVRSEAVSPSSNTLGIAGITTRGTLSQLRGWQGNARTFTPDARRFKFFTVHEAPLLGVLVRCVHRERGRNGTYATASGRNIYSI